MGNRITIVRTHLRLPILTTDNRKVPSRMYLLVLNNVVSASVASSAVTGEHLSSILKIGGECGRGDRHHTDNDGSGDLLLRR